jgi:hypothetical protein
MSNSYRKPAYKRGDLVWRSGVGFGIVLKAEAYEGKEWYDPSFHYTILWDRGAEERGGFQEWEIASMRYELENAS